MKEFAGIKRAIGPDVRHRKTKCDSDEDGDKLQSEARLDWGFGSGHGWNLSGADLTAAFSHYIMGRDCPAQRRSHRIRSDTKIRQLRSHGVM